MYLTAHCSTSSSQYRYLLISIRFPVTGLNGSSTSLEDLICKLLKWLHIHSLTVVLIRSDLFLPKCVEWGVIWNSSVTRDIIDVTDLVLNFHTLWKVNTLIWLMLYNLIIFNWFKTLKDPIAPIGFSTGWLLLCCSYHKDIQSSVKPCMRSQAIFKINTSLVVFLTKCSHILRKVANEGNLLHIPLLGMCILEGERLKW